jgi:hypothetical protein
VSTAAIGAALAAIARDEGIDAMHRAVLVLDGAGWHTSSKLVMPDGVDLVFLPPASPELQPVERVWRLVDEPVANRTFADLEPLTDLLVTRCQTLRADRRTLASGGGPVSAAPGRHSDYPKSVLQVVVPRRQASSCEIMARTRPSLR